MSSDWPEKWRENVANKLIADRDAAEARYLREHRRAAFMEDRLRAAWDALPDYIGRTPSDERCRKAMEDVGDALAPWINAMGGDVAWYDQDFDFDEWERNYFGPRPVDTSVNRRTD